MGKFALPRGIIWVLLLAGGIFFFAQNWGLPSLAADGYLYGHNHQPWTGAQLLKLAGGWSNDQHRGADVAEQVRPTSTQPVLANATDADRARIIIRYHLYSNQPDEMITFRALAQMRPFHGPMGGMDPKLYQYGGLWIYPIGVLLKILPLSLRSDIAWYLDHPEAFGRFYVVARCYSAGWGLFGVVIVYLLVRQATQGWIFPTLGAALFSVLPVVVNQAHEAKPHLAGTVLMLWAVLAATKYVLSGSHRLALVTGVLCGAACGMVLSSYPVFLILPAMIVLRKEKIAKVALPTLVAIAVYFATNPYVAINLLVNRAVLESNLGNSSAMYHAGLSIESLWNAILLIVAGMSLLPALAGGTGVVCLAISAIRHRHKRFEAASRQQRAMGILLLLPAVWVAVQFVLLADRKPGEYGRFALYLDVALAILGMVAIATFVQQGAPRWGLPVMLILSAAMLSWHYLLGFDHDTGIASSRYQTAGVLSQQLIQSNDILILSADPAPYCLPPVDLFAWRIMVSPDVLEGAGVHVWPADNDDLRSSLVWPRISWANKRFAIVNNAPG